MKKWIIILLLLILGCSGGSIYDQGYEDGIRSDKNPSKYRLNKEYHRGYDDGIYHYYFDLGMRDAKYDQQPRFPDIDDYMAGYAEGEE